MTHPRRPGAAAQLLRHAAAAPLLLFLLLCSQAGAQAPAPGPSLAQEVGPTPVFAGQAFNTTPSTGNMNALISAAPSYTVRDPPVRSSASFAGRAGLHLGPGSPARLRRAGADLAVRTQQLPTQLSGVPKGLLKLGIGAGPRDGYLYVPSIYHVQSPSPLMLCLHAAGKGGLDGLAPLLPFAEAAGERLSLPC